MQLSAFTPFYRNHNQRGALSQEPYRWDTGTLRILKSSYVQILCSGELFEKGYRDTLFNVTLLGQ